MSHAKGTPIHHLSVLWKRVARGVVQSHVATTFIYVHCFFKFCIAHHRWYIYQKQQTKKTHPHGKHGIIQSNTDAKIRQLPMRFHDWACEMIGSCTRTLYFGGWIGGVTCSNINVVWVTNFSQTPNLVAIVVHLPFIIPGTIFVMAKIFNAAWCYCFAKLMGFFKP